MASWLSPEQALALIPSLSGDYRLQPLAGGHSNPVWRVDSGQGVSQVLRLHQRQQQRAVNREAEHWAWQQAAAAGIAPQLTYWDPHHRFSLSQYLDGTALASYGANPAQIAQLAALLAGLTRPQLLQMAEQARTLAKPAAAAKVADLCQALADTE